MGKRLVRASPDESAVNADGEPLLSDAKWNVYLLWDASEKEGDYVLILDVENKIQGYVVIFSHDYEGEDGGRCVFINFLATAPWNRRLPERQTREFIGCGKMLVASAILFGWEDPDNIAVELFSKKDAEEFYRKMGFVETEKRDKDGLKLYRLEKDKSLELVKSLMDNVTKALEG